MEAEGGPTRWAEKALAVLPNLRRLDGIAAVSWRTKITEGNEVQLKELFDKMDADGSGKQPASCMFNRAVSTWLRGGGLSNVDLLTFCVVQVAWI